MAEEQPVSWAQLVQAVVRVEQAVVAEQLLPVVLPVLATATVWQRQVPVFPAEWVSAVAAEPVLSVAADTPALAAAAVVVATSVAAVAAAVLAAAAVPGQVVVVAADRPISFRH
jgi:hypothetical protein